MEIPSLVGHCSEVIRIILKSHQPPDLILSQYLRSKKYIGSFDRRFISELVFFYLRIKSLPDYILNVIVNSGTYNDLSDEIIIKDSLLILLVLIQQNLLMCKANSVISQPNEDQFLKLFITSNLIEKELTINNFVDFKNSVCSLFQELNLEIESKLLVKDQEIIDKIGIRYGQQSWIVDKIIKKYNFNYNDMGVFFNSFLEPSPLTIRVEKKADLSIIREHLLNIEIETTFCNFSPVALYLNKRLDLNTVPLYKSGRFEVQDEGSQLISFALDPQPNESILDACAGAGGKSMHIASLQHDSGRIVSCDVELSKLRELNKRSARCGYKSIETVLDHNLEKLDETFSKVLIDAPCTGMGTIRRNPIPKWRLTEEYLSKHIAKQDKILEYYSQFVEPGGELIYSTCSILPDENEFVIERFLSNHKEFEPLALKPSFKSNGIEIPDLGESDYQLQLLPSKHGCDGFFMAKLQRKD
jgi:16S rRNA (cytosine967-C5)-methyltransferase